MSTPTFSVLVPVYNHEKYIGPALDSLLAQTDPDWEAVVVNDGSTDGTPAVIEAYARRDARIRVFHKTNGGVSTALNRGLAEVTGEWVCWLSSDDLFEPDKLAVHRGAFGRHPRTAFFCTRHRELDHATGRITDAAPWRDIPEEPWQALETMRCPFVHGNSICVRRTCFDVVGNFSEDLRLAQDYDMWLRILVKFPAVFLSDFTCITRCHTAQTTHGFPEACFYDSAVAAMRVLNTTPLRQLVPAADSQDPADLERVLRIVLSVAENRDAFLYKLGAHPLLLWRAAEWILNETPDTWRAGALRLLGAATARVAADGAAGDLAWYWKSVHAVASNRVTPFRFAPLDPMGVARRSYWSAGDPVVGTRATCRRYLERCRVQIEDVPAGGTADTGRSVVVLCQVGADAAMPVRYGALRATVERARALMRRGHRVLLVGRGPATVGFADDVPFIAGDDDRQVLKLARAMAPGDVLVGVSRGDGVGVRGFGRYVIYHHGPHAPTGPFSADFLRRARVPVLCVSDYSRKHLAEMGLSPAQLRLLPNGYDSGLFGPPVHRQVQPREPHRLVFAGMVEAYKGIECLLEAFETIRQQFPDAALDICGISSVWPRGGSLFARRGWLRADGLLDWPRIEADVPGVRYRGELSQADLAAVFRQSSIILMPSLVPETFGLVLVEAQACGCIPVVPRQGGFPETLRDGETGFLYEPNTAEALASAIARLWRAGQPGDEQRRAAQRWVAAAFTWESGNAELARWVEDDTQADGHVSWPYRVGAAAGRAVAASRVFHVWQWRWQDLRRRMRSGRRGHAAGNEEPAP